MRSDTTENTDKAEFDSYSGNYKALVNDSLPLPGFSVDYFTKVKAEYLKDILRKAFKSTFVDALDLGCGVGNFHKILRPCMRTLTGADVSIESINLARAHNQDVAYQTFDGLNLPFEKQSFDLVFAVCVFHHVPVAARPRLMADVRRILRPNGVFVVFEHNPLNPLTMRTVNNCVFDRDAVLLKSGEAEDLLSDSGFRNVVSRFILAIPSFNKVSRALDQLFGSLPLGAQYFTMGRA